MNQTSMEAVLAQVKRTPTFTAHHPESKRLCHYRFDVQPVTLWEPRRMERHLALKLPGDLRVLWAYTAGIDAQCENDSWSLRLWSPFEAMFHTQEVNAMSGVLCEGDLIIGAYHDDGAWLIVRCRADAYDFGRVCVAQVNAPRESWQVVADSLGDFLQQTIALPQVDYWRQAAPDALFPCA